MGAVWNLFTRSMSIEKDDIRPIQMPGTDVIATVVTCLRVIVVRRVTGYLCGIGEIDQTTCLPPESRAAEIAIKVGHVGDICPEVVSNFTIDDIVARRTIGAIRAWIGWAVPDIGGLLPGR